MALTPLMLAIIFGILTYASFPNAMGAILFTALIILSVWLGVIIFKTVANTPLVEIITSNHATPGLDNLELDSSSETKKRQPDEYAKLVRTNEHLCKVGSIRIYGDWFGKPYTNHHKITTAEYQEEDKKLTIHFDDDERIEVYNPMIIFESTAFLKITHADLVRWSWYAYRKSRTEDNMGQLEYTKENKVITTKTWPTNLSRKFDTSLSAPALMIYGAPF